MDVYIGRIHIPDCKLQIKVQRKIDRRLEQYTSGDDLVDLGRSSYEFRLEAKMDLETFKNFLAEIDKEQPIFKSDFGEFKVVVKDVEYHSPEHVNILMVEDIR